MSKINDALNDAQKSRLASQGKAKVVKDVLNLLDDIQKPAEEIIKKREEQGILPLGDTDRIHVLDTPYQLGGKARKNSGRYTLGKPVLALMFLFVLSFLALWFYNLKTQNLTEEELRQTAASYQAVNARLRSEHSALKSEQADLKNQMNDLKLKSQSRIAQLEKQNTQLESQIAQLEGQMKVQREQNKKLSVRALLLREENLEKQRIIERLSAPKIE